MNGTIRLKLARKEFWSGGGFSGSFAPVAVKVKNLAFWKQVVVRYTPDGTTWKEVPLAFGSPGGDYDLFTGTINEQVAQFVLRYTVNGETFYDNNFGQDYRFGPHLATVGGNVILNLAVARRGTQAGGGFVIPTAWLEGEILVNNLSFAKEVGIRLSADGGVTWHDTGAAFAGSQAHPNLFIGAGAEVWRFKTPERNLDSTTPDWRVAVFYRDGATGAVYWDNNFGQDYRLSKADGATIA